MVDEGYVLVIGAAGMDVKGHPDAPLVYGTSNPGYVRHSVGGVARNIAENLARLEVPTILISAVGDDAAGQRVLEQARESNIDTSYIQVVPGAHTGVYMALMKPEGGLDVAVDDFEVLKAITPRYLREHSRLFAEASMVAVDANLEPGALKTVCSLAARHKVPVCADPTSKSLAPKLRPHLNQLMMVAPNMAEAFALCNEDDTGIISEKDRDMALIVAKKLVSQGVQIAIVTLGEWGVVYADSSSSGHVPAIRTEVIDSTGAGDALTAAVIFGLLNEIPLDESVRLGAAAASLTLRSRETVVPDLSLEMLYDQLAV